MLPASEPDPVKLTDLIHVLVQHKNYAPGHAWSLSIAEIMLLLSPTEAQERASDKGSWLGSVAKVAELVQARVKLTPQERVELEMYKLAVSYC